MFGMFGQTVLCHMQVQAQEVESSGSSSEENVKKAINILDKPVDLGLCKVLFPIDTVRPDNMETLPMPEDMEFNVNTKPVEACFSACAHVRGFVICRSLRPIHLLSEGKL